MNSYFLVKGLPVHVHSEDSYRLETIHLHITPLVKHSWEKELLVVLDIFIKSSFVPGYASANVRVRWPFSYIDKHTCSRNSSMHVLGKMLQNKFFFQQLLLIMPAHPAALLSSCTFTSLSHSLVTYWTFKNIFPYTVIKSLFTQLSNCWSTVGLSLVHSHLHLKAWIRDGWLGNKYGFID